MYNPNSAENTFDLPQIILDKQNGRHYCVTTFEPADLKKTKKTRRFLYHILIITIQTRPDIKYLKKNVLSLASFVDENRKYITFTDCRIDAPINVHIKH